MGHTKEQGAHIGDRGEDIHPGVFEEAFLPHDGGVISLEVAWDEKRRLNIEKAHQVQVFHVPKKNQGERKFDLTPAWILFYIRGHGSDGTNRRLAFCRVSVDL